MKLKTCCYWIKRRNQPARQCGMAAGLVLKKLGKCRHYCRNHGVQVMAQQMNGAAKT